MTASSPADAPAAQRKHKGRTVNTCAPSSRTRRLQSQLDGILAHLEVHPNDDLSKARVSKIKSMLSVADVWPLGVVRRRQAMNSKMPVTATVKTHA